MATANTNKTILALGFVAVLGFLAYKLWPAIRRAINSGSGGSGGVGPASAAGLGPYSSPQQAQNNPFSGLSAGIGTPGSGQGGPQTFGNTIGGLIAAMTYAGNTPGQQTYLANLLDQPESGYPTSIPLQPLQNLTDLPSWSPDDPNAPWNSGTDLSDYSPADDSSWIDTTSYIPGEDDYSIDYTDGGGDGVSAGGDGGY